MNIVVMNNQARSLVNFWTILLKRMLRDGHRVICLVPPNDPAAEAVLRELGAEVRNYPLDPKGLNPLRDLRTFRALCAIFREIRPDLLYASTIKPVIYGLPAARLVGIPRRYAMITGLGYMFEADNVVKTCLTGIAALLYRLSLGCAQAVFFQNADDVNTFRRWHCLPTGARVVMTRGTGVDTTHFAPCPLPGLDGTGGQCPVSTDGTTHGSADRMADEGAGGTAARAGAAPIFLLVARLLEAKGLREYAAAARLVKATHPEARFQLLGPPETGRGGVSLDEVRGWEKEGLIDYLGETRDTRPYVGAASVIVLPSWREGLPCSLMEGMSMGRALVATDVPGCRDIVREGVGFLVPVRDPAALAEACARFVRDPALAVRMGAAGRALAVEDYDAARAADLILHEMKV